MKGITTLAALPGSGAGCAAALRAETVPAEKKQSWYTPAEVEAVILDRVCQRIVSDLITKPLNAWLESDEGAKAIAALKEPAPRAKWPESCPVKFEEPPIEPPNIVRVADFLDAAGGGE